MTSKEALEKLSYIPIYEEDIDIIFKGDLCEVYRNEVDIISKDLDRLEKLEKENNKFKKVIEILVSKIEFEDLGEMQSGYIYRGYFNDCFDEEEVKSIEEVEEDD